MFTRIATTLSIAAAALISFGATPAFANGEATPDYPQVFTSQLSRADVQQATANARAAGLIVAGESTVVAENFISTKTRAQVKAEFAEARRLGLLDQGEIVIVATPQQNEQIRLAGLKTAMPMLAAR